MSQFLYFSYFENLRNEIKILNAEVKIECKISKNSDNLHLLLIMFFSQLKFYLIIEIPKLAESWSTEQVLYGGGSVC